MRAAILFLSLVLIGCSAGKKPPRTSPRRGAAPRDVTPQRRVGVRPPPKRRPAPARAVTVPPPQPHRARTVTVPPPQPHRARAVKGARGRPWLGVWMRVDRNPGVLLMRVVAGSPAATAGLMARDRALSIDGVALRSSAQMQQIIASHRPGETVQVLVERRGQRLRIGVLLQVRPSYAQTVRNHLLGKPAPSFSAVRVGAVGPRIITPKALLGKLWLLELWASWCGACRRAIPLLKVLHKQYAPYGLHMVAIAKDPVARVAPLVRAWSLPYIVGADPQGKVMSAYLINPIPAFVLVNRKGVVIDVAVGRTWVTSFRRMLRTAHQILTANPKPSPTP
ncbi:MAG: redoxin domain-containing protein [bacterium]